MVNYNDLYEISLLAEKVNMLRNELMNIIDNCFYYPGSAVTGEYLKKLIEADNEIQRYSNILHDSEYVVRAKLEVRYNVLSSAYIYAKDLMEYKDNLKLSK